MSRSKDFDELWVEDEDGCHIWTGGKTGKGYGRYHGVVAHKYRWEQLHGPVPEGLELDHLCERKPCICDEHLEPVTHKVNLHRSKRTLASINAAKTHCPRGHPYDDDNTYRWRNKRYCRICLAINSKASRQRQKERLASQGAA